MINGASGGDERRSVGGLKQVGWRRRRRLGAVAANGRRQAGVGCWAERSMAAEIRLVAANSQQTIRKVVRKVIPNNDDN